MQQFQQTSLSKFQVKCNSQTWIKVPDNNELCEYQPYELVLCDIRARRESNSQENKDSEISRDSLTTDCAGEYNMPVTYNYVHMLSSYFYYINYISLC